MPYRATVTAVDVNERALALANENAAALGVEGRFVACLPEAVPSDATYDEIWSNPPIRIGKPALHDLLLAWLPRLRPGGRVVMVVGKNLGADSLQRWLGEQGYPTRRLASAKGFRVLESRRRRVMRAGPGYRVIRQTLSAVPAGVVLVLRRDGAVPASTVQA